ncbi:FAD:protein FMN transferase [Cereibacter sphaeroides]|uniref:FAD:protein FMN transferase n=1 Tax=Cereibacter sphaeroides TaxID=1063 RepID=UPI001F360B08|nr:FAD:protein FMN transferase [Cereibacter sphaeroides]MCE6951505.1 FAD:protein FMN transferase [Cereibacter sphaeroides]
MNRRRFLTISAAFAATPAFARPPLREIRGQAMGARVSLLLAHPEAEAVAGRALAEIARLEAIFSLYRDSALVRLNRDGVLGAPPFELLDCLALCSRVHEATEGLFDPTVQPLWALHAATHSAGRPPSAAELAAARDLTGWRDVVLDEAAVQLGRPGMALTLNGIAQGYIADRIGDRLRAEGMTDVLVDTGELRALGGRPGGGDWPVTLAEGQGTLSLRDRALASSAPRGTVFDVEGKAGHILDPRTGHPAEAPWRLVSVTGPSAALADAASTAFCLMDRPQIEAALARMPELRLAALA